jgi:hypothetical protein
MTHPERRVLFSRTLEPMTDGIARDTNTLGPGFGTALTTRDAAVGAAAGGGGTGKCGPNQ